MQRPLWGKNEKKTMDICICRTDSFCCATETNTTLYINYTLTKINLKKNSNINGCSGADSKESACNVGNPGLIPESERSPGEGNGNPLQDSFMENLMNGGAWQAAIYRVAKS